jgi:hypothetical protein
VTVKVAIGPAKLFLQIALIHGPEPRGRKFLVLTEGSKSGERGDDDEGEGKAESFWLELPLALSDVVDDDVAAVAVSATQG